MVRGAQRGGAPLVSRVREGTAVKKAKRVTLAELKTEMKRIGMPRRGDFMAELDELLACLPFGTIQLIDTPSARAFLLSGLRALPTVARPKGKR